jgi:AraC-like DNA-binding protein
LRRAKAELESGSARRVKEIAGELGYGDVSHFIKVFKRAYGLAPEAYRRSLGGREAE